MPKYEKTTITASPVLMKRVSEHIAKKEETQSDFYNRAILNQLENEGDFEIRDLWEEEQNAESN